MDLMVMSYKKMVIAIIMILPCIPLHAQEVNDSTQNAKVEDVKTKKIKVEEYKQLKNDQKLLADTKANLNTAQADLKNANKEIENLKHDISKKDSQLKNDTLEQSKLQNEISSLKERLVQSDKHLINMASNFLWLPYEEYSIESIAIPACKYVQSQELKQLCEERLEMLKNYQSDVKALVEILKSKNFGSSMSVDLDIEKFKRLPAYSRYHKYAWLEGAFLFEKINLVENRLNAIKGRKPSKDFKDILRELEKCLESINQE